jgi:cyclic beta-1,2-glucan synthetase
MYKIVVTQTAAEDAIAHFKVDGVAQEDSAIALIDDQREHAVEILMRSAPAKA